MRTGEKDTDAAPRAAQALAATAVSRRTDCFGRMCQVFSTYEILRAPRDPMPFRRGIQSIQLLDDGRRWWIASMVWDNEVPDNPIQSSAAPVESPPRQGVGP